MEYVLFVTNIIDDVTQIKTPVKTKGFQATRHTAAEKPKFQCSYCEHYEEKTTQNDSFL